MVATRNQYKVRVAGIAKDQAKGPLVTGLMPKVIELARAGHTVRIIKPKEGSRVPDEQCEVRLRNGEWLVAPGYGQTSLPSWASHVTDKLTETYESTSTEDTP